VSEKKAVVLLSGGLDSTTTLAIAQRQGFDVYAMTFRYGQRHEIEIEAAQRIAKQMQVTRQIIVDIDLRVFGGSALTGEFEVPKQDSIEQMTREIPLTYVPARNTIFLSFALAWAEVLASKDVFLGVNALDYSGYPDCRPEYIQAFQQMANLATKAGVEGNGMTIHAPLIHLTKSQIIAQGTALGVDYSLTTSCYDPNPEGRACGHCDACLLRQRGFDDLNMPDPTQYADEAPRNRN
jgi:7-cyano-7-deazaguanine synthase